MHMFARPGEGPPGQGHEYALCERPDNLYGPGAELRINKDSIGDNWYVVSQNGMPESFADECLVALIFRVNGNTPITKHGFWAGGGNNEFA